MGWRKDSTGTGLGRGNRDRIGTQGARAWRWYRNTRGDGMRIGAREFCMITVMVRPEDSVRCRLWSLPEDSWQQDSLVLGFGKGPWG